MIVRARHDGDLPSLTTALRAVHDRDGYPVRWQADPAAWLTPDGLRRAWVVERDARPVGHVALTGVATDTAGTAGGTPAPGRRAGGCRVAGPACCSSRRSEPRSEPA